MKNKPLFIKTKAIVLLAFIFSLCACASQPLEKEAALLSDDNEQARSEIIELVTQSMGGKKIPIANNVFQDSSRLLLGKVGVTSPEGVKIIPSTNEAAIIFELVKQGDNCLLRRLNTTQEWILTTKSCVKR